MVLNPGCKLESPGRFLKTPMVRLCSDQLLSPALGWEQAVFVHSCRSSHSCKTFGHFGEECIREVCLCTFFSFNIITDIVFPRNKMILLLTSSWVFVVVLVCRESKDRVRSLESIPHFSGIFVFCLLAIGNGTIWGDYTGNLQLF